MSSDVTRHLIQQLVGLLHHLHLTPLAVRSEVSQALREHRGWADLHPDQPAITRTRLRNLHQLRDLPHAQPLVDLLLQMAHVLDTAHGVNTHRFDSGPNMAEPWIGFNINDMAWFFYVPLDRPEILTIERRVDPRLFDGTLGTMEQRCADGLSRWRATLDLADPKVGFLQCR